MKKIGIAAFFLFFVLIIALVFSINNFTSTGTVIGIGSKEVILYDFYGKGCPHCAKLISFLDDIELKYSNIKIIKKEIYFDDANRELFQDMAASFGEEISGVPTVFIDDKVFVGFSDSIGASLEKEIERCSLDGCNDPMEHVKTPETTSIVAESSPLEDPGKTKLKQSLTLGAVISAAAVDAINPCAFAVLIILLTTILAADNRKRALYAGLAFTFSIYISYFLMGLGLYSAIQAAKFTHYFYTIVAVLAILVGLFNLKDFFAYGKWFVMEVPVSWRPRLKCIIGGVTSVPGAFLIGFIVSLFLLPCTSGPYIVILGLLAKTATKNYALLLLLIYNLIFILPMLLITGAIYFGLTTTHKAEKWRKKQLKILHLIAGIIILLLGIGMFVAMYFGWV
ncbi:hypothetical protein JW851_00220 [Candidatus Woesearchaeota archaeon]|nr:hypothetical protein [Candidatus Woesearchaeota archaeon]